MNTSYIPQPQDSNMAIETAITKTATYAGTAFDYGNGFAPGGNGMPVNAVIDITALDHSDGNETYTFQLTESDDNITYTACGPAVAVTAIGVVAIPGIQSKRYSKLSLTEAGTTPSLTYSAWLNPNGFAAAR